MRRLITQLKKNVPYLRSTKSRLWLIAFISIFSFIFIALYNPFNLDKWGENLYVQFVVLGAVVLGASQFLLLPIVKPRKFRFYGLVLWFLVEMVLLTSVFYFLYGRDTHTINGMIYEFWDTFFQVGLVVVVPYALFVWYSEVKYRFSEFEHIRADIKSAGNNDSNKLLAFYGDKEKVIFAIKFKQLLYVKSAGNYLELYYRKGDETVKELVRASIKELEGKIMDTQIIKIHRSFLVNMEHVLSFKKNRKGYTLLIHHVPEVLLPVSAGYKLAFEQKLGQKVSR